MTVETAAEFNSKDCPVPIALVTTELRTGGAERCLVNLATGLDRRRYDPVVYSLAPLPSETRSELVNRLQAAEVPVQSLELRRWWQLSLAVRRLAEMLRQQSPSVVQTFLFHANVVGALAAGRVAVPHVVAGLRVAERPRWRLWLQRRLEKRVSKFVCVSPSVSTYFQTRGRLPADKIAVIPNGVAVSQYASASMADVTQLGVTAGRRVLLYVGRLDRQKGIDRLVRLAPQMLGQLTEYDLLVVGDGPQRRQLNTAVRNTPLAARVHFAGWRTDVPALLQAADLVLLPSRWEGMPHVLLETMAGGRPVVATDVEGVRDVLGPLAEHQVVSVGRDADFLDRIVQLCSDRQLARQLGQQNQQHVSEEFSLGKMIRSYDRLYTSLLTS